LGCCIVLGVWYALTPVGARSVPSKGAATSDSPYTNLVTIPSELNGGLTSPTQAFLLSLLGSPGDLSPVACANETRSDRLAALLVLESVGPFRVTGLKPAVAALRGIFVKVKLEKPSLYSQLGSVGMLCIRAVRGRPKVYSNHAWGTAIDITIGGKLVPQGSKQTLLGLLDLYPYFHAAKFFWGAGFSGGRSDPMHFEASRELLQEWGSLGVLKPR
jgi:hypothetical protein